MLITIQWLEPEDSIILEILSEIMRIRVSYLIKVSIPSQIIREILKEIPLSKL